MGDGDPLRRQSELHDSLRLGRISRGLKTEALPIAIHGLAMVVALMAVLWVIHLRIRNAAIVDFGWAFGLAMLAVLDALEAPGYSARKWLIAILAAVSSSWPARSCGATAAATSGLSRTIRCAGFNRSGRQVEPACRWPTPFDPAAGPSGGASRSH